MIDSLKDNKLGFFYDGTDKNISNTDLWRIAGGVLFYGYLRCGVGQSAARIKLDKEIEKKHLELSPEEYEQEIINTIYKQPYNNMEPETDFDTARKNTRWRWLAGRYKAKIVLTDYDIKEHFERRLAMAKALGQHCIAYESRKGGHILWTQNPEYLVTKNNSKNYTFLTLTVDYKIGALTKEEERKSNNVAAISLPDGSLRRIRYINLNDSGELDPMPYYDSCMYNQKQMSGAYKDSVRFCGMSEGVRNESLFAYTPKLKGHGLTYEQMKETICLINEYLLVDPLDSSEIEVITRKSAWDSSYVGDDVINDFTEIPDGSNIKGISAQKKAISPEEVPPEREPFDAVLLDEHSVLYGCDQENYLAFFGMKNDGTLGDLYHNKFARYLMTRYRVCRIGELLYRIRNGVHISGKRAIDSMIIGEIDFLDRKSRGEVTSYIDTMARSDIKRASERFIAFSNGVLDIDSEELTFYTYEEAMNVVDGILTNPIPHKYNSEADTEYINEFLTSLSCGDETVYQQLLQCAGLILYRSNRYKRAFIFVGAKDNGKSTFLNLLQYMAGYENVSAISMEQFTERFKIAEIDGKLLNIGDDISDGYIADTSFLKKVISGEPITVERKNKDPYYFSPYTKLVFSANQLPRLSDKTGAAIERFVIINFRANFSQNNSATDTELRAKLNDENTIEALIKLAVLALRDVRVNKRVLETEETIKLKQEWNKDSNPHLEFFEEVGGKEYFLNKDIKECFERYREYLRDNGYKEISQRRFTSLVCEEFNLTTTKWHKGLMQGRFFVSSW